MVHAICDTELRVDLSKVPVTLAFSLAFGFCLYVKAGSAETITAAEAKNHIGETATVCGKVESANYAARSRGQPTFLNLDEPYPHQIFTVLIWGSDRDNFKRPEKTYDGESVCVTGKIVEYRGVPEIVARAPDQITVRTGFFGPLVVVLVLGAAGASAFWYFRRRKRPVIFDEIEPLVNRINDSPKKQHKRLWSAEKDHLSEKLQILLGCFISAAIPIFILAVLILGVRWIANHIYPWLTRIAAATFLIDLFIFFPLMAFKRNRIWTSFCLFVSSYVFGLQCWISAFILTYLTLGPVWLCVGLLLAGIGIVPFALVGSVIQSDWSNFLVVMLLLAITLATRLLPLKIWSLADNQDS